MQYKKMKNLYPLFFKPLYKDYIWGGERIIKTYERVAPPGRYAESWEISDRSDGMSLVANGPLKGTSLHSLIKDYKAELFGPNQSYERFPLLVKLIDANENLSIQVHPSDQTAKLYGGEAKTEAWHILESDPQAAIYAGFIEQFDKKEIENALPTRKIVNMMQKISTQSGDTIFIPGGRLHAIGKGSLLLEVQQNSNTTYRVYDWDRVDERKGPRPLHIKQASQVLLWDDTQNPVMTPTILRDSEQLKVTQLISTPYFQMERWDVFDKNLLHKAKNRWDILFLLEGEATFCHEQENIEWKKGSSCLIPASCSDCKIEIKTHPFCFIKIFI